MTGFSISTHVMKSIEQLGVRHVFLVPGKLVYPLLDALNKTKSLLGIVSAHETACGFMADGYARANRTPGVCLAISGPGTMNLVPAMAAAQADQVPVLYIVGGVSSELEGRGAFQDGNAGGLAESSVVRSLVSAATEIKNGNNLIQEQKRLLTHVNWFKRGRAYLGLPIDIQKKMLSHGCSTQQWVESHSKLSVPANIKEIEAVLKKYILQPTRVAILAGSRANTPEVAELLVQVAEKYMIPVATTLSGKGAFPEDHPLALGVYGFASHIRAACAINENKIDILISLGCDLNQRDSSNWTSMLGYKKRLVAIDDSFDQMATNYPVDQVIFSGIAQSLETMLAYESRDAIELEQVILDRDEWVKTINQIPLFEPHESQREGSAVHPGSAIKLMRKHFPHGTNVVVDSGAHRIFMAHYWQASGTSDYFSSSTIAPMGWAIAAGIGVKLAAPDKHCLVVTGDGCMLMHGTEIQTAARYRVKVIFVVLNNSAHGAIHIDAITNGNISSDFTKLPQHNWTDFAAALGVPSLRAYRQEEIENAIESAMHADGPYLIEIMTGVYPAPNKFFSESLAATKATHEPGSPSLKMLDKA